VKISQRSTLVLEGPGVTVEALDLDGALVVRAVPGARVTIRRLAVRNAGWALTALSPEEAAAAAPPVRIRGFRVDRREARVLEFSTPGEYTVDE
jgi:UDP-sugar pyrophosphorylase